ncbi:cysteine desulfurase NifS [Sulfurimicrobium lacus]|uniref:cysteine desulfurase n=1 Tax=Sulfurimicrobium lacus TaxID=2715678 RepID=A0A6F8VBI3_9PROT|nr:cysteine desulfurase family protein [Sulfurimicrobium lacus]BCB26690.1 cysteine desulfurase NifS [Sulfurimicrobium lacus]
MSQAYFDHNATTPLDDAVLAAMMPYLQDRFGNPSSRHGFGRGARQAVEEAREKVAATVGAHPSQVIFVSGGTEANNLAIRGMAAVLPVSQIVHSGIEHPSVAKPCRDLQQQGWKPRTVAVDRDGRCDMNDLAQSLRESTGLVSVMLANNETGVIQDVAAVAQSARAAGAWVHTDAVQALGKIEVDFASLGVHAMSLSGHKIYGPKGVGALVMDKRVELLPQISGGGHEKGLRAGTENVPAIVGFGVACELAVNRMLQDAERIGALRTEVERGVAALGGVVFGGAAPRLVNTSYFAFPGVEGETLLMALDRAGFAVASGSACSSGSTEPSAVLLAMGVAAELAKGAVRVSLGRANTRQQVQEFIAVLQVELGRLRSMLSVELV